MRQDAWTADDDLILAETTLRHIREGGTQLKAFEEVGERLGRTSAACGFRWNSFVRKTYDTAIQIAKAQRQQLTKLKKKKPSQKPAVMFETMNQPQKRNPVAIEEEHLTEEMISVDAVIRFLKQWKTMQSDQARIVKQLEKDIMQIEKERDEYKKHNEYLQQQVDNVQTDYRVVNDDYKALIQIMDRARKMAVLTEETDNNKQRFKMDANGNLERIEQ